MNFVRNSRYHLNPCHFRRTCISPVSDLSYSAISSSGCPLIHRKFGSIASRSYHLCNYSIGSNLFFQSGISYYGFGSYRNDLGRYSCDFRLYSTSVAINNDSSNNNASAKKAGTLDDYEVPPTVIKGIIDIVRNDAIDMESKLDLVGLNLSKWSIIKVFGVLNQLKVPALRFFDWIRSVHSRFSRNADLCSLAIDNCGRLEDFSALRSLLKDFRAKKICLSDRAFGFLNISEGSSEAAKKSIKEIVGLLDEVGGSCRSSGIHSLITMICSLNLVDLAKYVIEITEKKPSYYNILVKHMCVKGQLEGAQDMLAEMSRLRCDTDSAAYNYLISSLCMQGRIDEACSIPNKMIDRGCLPNELTYEILIYFTCRYGRSDDAVNLYNEMLSRGIEPRLRTHSAFIRGYVSTQRFDEAYIYIVDAAAKDKWSAAHMYNVLASLHIEHGDLIVAHKLLVEMFEKGLNPKFSVYRRASKRLHKTGRSELAKILDSRHSSLVQELR